MARSSSRSPARTSARGSSLLIRSLFYDRTFLRKEVFGLLRIVKSLFIQLDDVKIRWRIGEGIETVYIVEPQFHNSVCVAQIRTGWPIAGNEALNVTAHIALHVGLTCEKGSMYVSPINHALLVGHIGSTAHKNMQFYHGVFVWCVCVCVTCVRC